MSVSIEHKEEIVEMETLPSRPDNDIKVEEEIAVLDSRFAHLGFKETVVKFRKVCLICMGIFVGALFDGKCPSACNGFHGAYETRFRHRHSGKHGCKHKLH